MKTVIYWAWYWLVKLLIFLSFPFKVVGHEHLPASGRFILASNHISYLDPPLVGSCLKVPLNYVARDSLFRNPILGFLLKTMNAFPIKRDSADFRGVREILRRLNHETPVLIFPEGTRLAERRSKRALPGVGFIIRKSKAPVYPVFLQGTDDALPPGAKWIRRRPVTIHFGRQIAIDPSLSDEQLAELVMDEIERLKP